MDGKFTLATLGHKETKRHREEETKSQRDCTTRPGGLDSRFLRKERPSVEKGTRTERKM